MLPTWISTSCFNGKSAMSLCPLDSTTCGGRGRERKNEAYQGPVAMSRGEVQLLGPSSYNPKQKGEGGLAFPFSLRLLIHYH